MLAFYKQENIRQEAFTNKSINVTRSMYFIEQSVNYPNWQVALYYSNRAVMYFCHSKVTGLFYNKLEKNNAKTVWSIMP